MSKKKRYLVAARTLNTRGASLVVTIPSSFVKYLGLNAGEQVVFILDTERKYIMMGKSETFGFKISELGAADIDVGIFRSLLSEEDLMALLKEFKTKFSTSTSL